jgi:alpha-N-arabinofuranosidase
MYKPFQDVTFIPSAFADLPEYRLGDVAVPRVSATAAKSAEGALLLGLVNLDPAEPVTIAATIAGFAAQSARGRVLTAGAMDAHSSFAEPERVKPAPIDVTLQEGTLRVELPAKSVTVITVR